MIVFPLSHQTGEESFQFSIQRTPIKECLCQNKGEEEDETEFLSTILKRVCYEFEVYQPSS
jgi:hypothetical protein